MPSYEYFCQACDATFDDLLISTEEIKLYSKEHPCPSCGAICPKIPSVTNFTFKGPAGSDPTSGRSSSGSHDLDYPSLDKAVGRSANRKWKSFSEKKKARDQVRRETGSIAITESKDGTMTPTNQNILSARETGLKTFKKARNS